MAVKPEIVDYINSHTEMVISETQNILGTITNKEVALTLESAEEFNFDELSAAFPEPVVGIDFKLANDSDGIIQLFIDKPTAARIGSLMMMMEEEEVEFTEEHVDAIKETTNQVLGAIATKMKETTDTALSFDDLNGQEVELAADMFDKPDLIAAKFSLKIGDDEPKTIFNVMTSSSIEALMNGEKTAETAAEEGEEAATEVAAEGEEAATEVAAEGEEAGAEFDISSVLDEQELGEAADEVEAPVGVPAEKPKPVSEIESKFDFLMDLTFPVSIELGRTKMLIKDILDLGHGSVIEFEKLAGEPVDLLVEDKKIAEGEVVVVDEHFGIRITNLVHKAEFLKTLGSR